MEYYKKTSKMRLTIQTNATYIIGIIRIIIALSFLFFSSSNSYSQNNEILKLLNELETSTNSNDFEKFQRLLSSDFSIDRSTEISSFIEAYTHYSRTSNYKHYKTADVIIQKKDSALFEVDFLKLYTYNKTKKQKCKLLIEQNNDSFLIKNYIEGFFDPNIDYRTTISYKLNLTDTLNKTKYSIVNPNDFVFIEDNGYKVYYDTVFHKEAHYFLDRLSYCDSFLRELLGFENVSKQHIILTQKIGTLICVGNDTYWTLSLTDDFEENKKSLLKELLTVTSHELTEATLIASYGLKSIAHRWYRDGISDYFAYRITKSTDSLIFNDYFLKGRYDEYIKHKGKFNILDWRGSHPIKKEEGKLYGSQFIYRNDYGQYGRSLQFFIDLSNQYGDEVIPKIHKSLKGKRNISQKKLIKLIAKATENKSETIILLISEY